MYIAIREERIPSRNGGAEVLKDDAIVMEDSVEYRLNLLRLDYILGESKYRLHWIGFTLQALSFVARKDVTVPIVVSGAGAGYIEHHDVRVNYP